MAFEGGSFAPSLTQRSSWRDALYARERESVADAKALSRRIALCSAE